MSSSSAASSSTKLNDFECGEFFFSSDFDSGNLRKVELVKSVPEAESPDNIIHAEFDLWTAPDCYGTPYENPNRTWFFFCIRGGRPFRNIKLNVRNLNRQAKLFSQGMQPVMRIGEHGKWERIKDKPYYATEGDSFYISFMHHTTDMTNIPHYYAFTYPFTYTECQNMLEKFDSKFARSLQDVELIVNRIASLEKEEKENPTKSSLNVVSSSSKIVIKDSNLIESALEEISTTLSPPPNLELGSELSLSPNPSESFYDKMSKKELENEIYYHRELLINSLEKRRVELITISSFHGIQNDFEERLSNLFPNSDTFRCRIFKDKKVIFMSSRVHPGETVASFVLNGFLNLLLDKKSLIAATLRQMYVFKIVPFLNPDGVYNGLYRTDTLGQNLNRMYICPQIDLHPSIYAVKKLIKYYHLGYDRFDEDNKVKIVQSESPRKPIPPILPPTKRIVVKKDEICSTESLFDFVEKMRNEVKIENEADSSNPNSSSKETTSSEGEENQSQNTTENTTPSSSSDSKVFTEKFIPEIKAIVQEQLPKKILPPAPPPPTGVVFGKKTLENLGRKTGFKTVFGGTHGGGMHRNNENKLKDVQNTTVQRPKFRKVLTRKDIKGATTTNVTVKGMNKKNLLCYQNIDISSEHMLNDSIDKPEKSNLFLYMDFHGHASKKGIFMYGNHFQSTPEAVECMLLPRLMGINCHHFHYDACNFSERNMYRREKRDGLSKEGSGRVAVYKMTGLIKCYTLESNYNTGKYVNAIPTRSKDGNPKPPTIVPPKYTPAIFEEVGRALGASILDLTNSNSISRIYNSEYRSIQALRIALRNEVERFGSQRPPINTGRILSSQQNVKRPKRSLLSASSSAQQNDVSKENKLIYHVPWELSVPSSSSTQNTSSSVLQALNQPKTVHKATRLIKRNPLKAHSTNLYGKKDATTSSKKKPIPSALLESCSSNKKDHSFQIPPKKVRVSPTQNLTKEVSAALGRKPQLIEASCSSDLLFKTLLTDNNTLAFESTSLVDILPTIDDNATVPSQFSSAEHPASSSSSHLLTKHEKSACSLTTSASMSQFYTDAEISRLKKCTSEPGLDVYGAKNDLAASLTGLSPPFKTSGSAVRQDDAIPSSSSRILVHSTNTKSLLGFRKTKKSDSFLLKVGTSGGGNLTSSFNSKAKSTIGCNENTKLGKKKRIIRHDSLIVKRKKNKAKITRH